MLRIHPPYLIALLLVFVLTSCTQQPAPPANELPIRALREPQTLTPPTTPMSVDNPKIRDDAQIQRGLQIEGEQQQRFLNASEIAQLPQNPTPVPYSASPSTYAFSGRLVAGILPYQDSAVDRRDRLQTLFLDSGRSLRGVVWIDGSFQSRGETIHDLGVMLLLDYQQIAFSLGGKVARSHIVRIPKDRGVLYDFAIPRPIPDGEYTLTLAITYDPTNLYTSYAFKEVYLNQGQRGLAGYWLPLATMYAWNSFLRVGGLPQSPNIVLSQPEVMPIPPDYPFRGLKLSRSNDPGDEITRRDSQVLAADEPGRLYAFVTYNPLPEWTDLQQTAAALTVFVDDQQMLIAGQPAATFMVEPGKLYRIPLDVAVPRDGYVHTLSAIVAFTAFLPSRYFDSKQPDWLPLATDPRSTRVVVLVPSRAWIP